jgi:ATP-dependent Lhr-like helicase
VAAADFMRFLIAWQRVDPAERVEGPESLAALLEQLEGFEAPAAAWEGEILPARMVEYDPAWLDAFCLAGKVVWGRLTPPGRATAPVRATPIALVGRAQLGAWMGMAPAAAGDDGISAGARCTLDHLARCGASFFDEIVAGTGLLRTQVEVALAELVARGLATSDSFTGLRALLTPSNRRPPLHARARRGSFAVFGLESAGRWTLLAARSDPSRPDPAAVEAIARALLRRYGVVFRRVVEREGALPPWRLLLRAYRRLEARGEIRGGRFVAGFAGEQFALPDAVGRLRAVRREPAAGVLVSVSAADPTNLVGLVTPGGRVPALAGNRVLFRDGVPIAVRERREVRFLTQLDPAARWAAEGALVRRRVAPRLRAYLGGSA